MSWVISLLLNSAALIIADYFIDGIVIKGFISAVIAAAALGFVNTFVKPVLVFLTFPFTVVTLGFFILVINAITFGFVSWLVPGFQVHSFGAAFIGAVITGIVGWLLNLILNER